MASSGNPDETLKRNLDFLRRRISNFSYAAIESSPSKPGIDVRVEEGAVEPVFEVSSPSGGRMLLHSRRNPLDEAERQLRTWIEKENPELKGMVVLAGAAGLYHAEALLKMLPQGATLLVADSHPENLREVLRYRDISHMHVPGVNFIFAVMDNLSLLAREYRHYLTLVERFSVAVFVPASLKRAFPRDCTELFEAIKKESLIEGLDRNTKANSCDEWIQHAIYNLPQLLHSPKIDALHGCWEGHDALVIGAGPSLNDSLPWIREIAGRCVIFSVGTALKPLLAGGVEPDFVVSIDSDIIILRQFQGIEKGNFFLLAPYSIFPELAQMFSGQTFYFANTALKSLNVWLKSFGALPSPAAAGGTVAVSAIDLARSFGCKRIIFTGLDLAVLKDGTSHAAESVYGGEKENPSELVPVPGNYEEKVLTSRQFAMYIDILNSYLDDAVKGGTLFYNATRGGASFRHTKLLLPEELPSFLWTELPPRKAEYIRKWHDEAPRPVKEEASNAMRDALMALRRLEADASAAGQICKMLASDFGKIRHGGRLLEELSRLDAKIKAERTANLLVTGSLEALFMDLYSSQDNEKNRDSEADLARAVKFYQHLKGGAEWMAGMLDLALQGYESNFKFIIGNSGK